MLESTFQLASGIGPAREQCLWKAGIAVWSDFRQTKDAVLPARAGQSLRQAKQQMSQAQDQLGEGQPKEAGQSMQQAAQSMQQAAQSLQQWSKASIGLARNCSTTSQDLSKASRNMCCLTSS